MVEERIEGKNGIAISIRHSHSSGWVTVESRKGLKIRVKTTVTNITSIKEVDYIV